MVGLPCFHFSQEFEVSTGEGKEGGGGEFLLLLLLLLLCKCCQLTRGKRLKGNFCSFNVKTLQIILTSTLKVV